MRAAARLLTAAALLLATVPASAQQVMNASDRAAGAQAHPQLLKEYGGAMQGAQADYVARIGKRVATQSGLSNAASDFTVTLLDSPIENAFALPGGYVYLTRQLLALMNSEAELAFVMGHEVGHVAARHAVKRNTRATIGTILATGIGVLTGSNLASQAAGYGAQMYTAGFSRTQEYQADALGVRYNVAAGYDPFAAPEMLESLNATTTLQTTVSGKPAGSGLPWLQTHPNGPDRVARAENLARQSGRRTEATDAQDVTFLRMLDGLPYDGGDAGQLRRVRVVTAGAGDTIETMARRMSYPGYQRERLLVLNGLKDDDRLRPGQLVKIIE